MTRLLLFHQLQDTTIGALGTLASYLIGVKVSDVRQQMFRTAAGAGILVLVGVAALIHLGYYDLLLRGAVDALVEFERTHPQIQMSTTIRKRVGWWGDQTVRIGYLLMLIGLAAFTIWSALDSRKHKRDTNATARRPSRTTQASV